MVGLIMLYVDIILGKKTFTRSSQIIGLSTFKYDYRPTVSLVEFVIHLF